MHSPDAFGGLLLARSSLWRLGAVAGVVVALWLAVVWAVALP